MNGIHDLGGMHGFGPVVAEPDEPVFHEAWERRAFALTLAMGAWGKWNIDMSRHAREQMPPAEYLATSYYEHWLFGLQRLLVEHGLLAPGELERRAAAHGAAPATRRPPSAPPAGAATPVPGALRLAGVQAMLRNRRGARMPDDVPPRFRPGDAVVTRNLNPVGHTRLPRYARGRRGVIDRDHGVFVFPDTHGAGRGRKPQHVYAVRFEARELWGPGASPRDGVYVDLWDDYLDPPAPPRGAEGEPA